jgi:predicted lactoylglutathione lyase
MRTISVSLPVRNLHASRAFFAELGFRFSAELSGDEIACMIVDRNISVLLVAEDRFRDCADGEIRQTAAAAGFVTGLSAGSEQEVDQTVAKAIAAGGKPWPILEERPVYSGSFQDLDGHVWQLTCPRHRQPGRRRS